MIIVVEHHMTLSWVKNQAYKQFVISELQLATIYKAYLNKQCAFNEGQGALMYERDISSIRLMQQAV